METNDISVKALSAFIEGLPGMGTVGDNTLKNLRAVPKMLRHVNPGVENFEDINAEETVEKFITETGAQVGDASRNSYKSRINQAIKLYKNYLSDPSSIFENRESEAKVSKEALQISSLPPKLSGAVTTIDIPVPIRDGLILTIPGVPTDLTNEEAERIASILKVYARPQ